MKKFLAFLLFIIVISIVFYMLFVFDKDSLKDDFSDYVKINNYEELKEFNPGFVQLKTDVLRNEIEEKEYITKLSLSIISGLSYYSEPYNDNIINIKELDDDNILFLTYLFMTKGKVSACIKDTYFLKQLDNYFKVNVNTNGDVKKYNYDAKGKYYCFKKVEYDKNNLEIDSYKKSGNTIKVSLKEDLEEEGIYRWFLEYGIDNNSYYLKSFQDLLEEVEEE